MPNKHVPENDDDALCLADLPKTGNRINCRCFISLHSDIIVYLVQVVPVTCGTTLRHNLCGTTSGHNLCGATLVEY